jgi:flagellar biosynthesis GTPase FlhF
MQTFPLTLAAIKTADRNQWAIGDALLAECGPPSKDGVRDGSYTKLKEAAEYLLGNGYEYAANTLAQFRDIADAFSPSNRRAAVAWGVHRVAGTPEFLEAVMAGAPDGKRVTQPYVEGIRQRIMDEQRREREKAAEKARIERERAEQEEAQARAKAREAREEEEKKAAKTKLAKAEAKTEKAKEKEQETKTAPKKKPGPPAKEDVPLLAIQAQFIADAAQSVKLARLSAKRIQESSDRLNVKGVAALTEAALEAANAWTEAARIVRSEIVNQSGHLSVVGE